MDVKFNQAAAAYANAGQMKGSLINGVQSDDNADGSSGSGAMHGPSFSDLLGDTLNKSRSTGYESESISAKALAGKAQLHDLVTSVSNAELTLDTVVAVRDRMISAYQDIVKMPI